MLLALVISSITSAPAQLVDELTPPAWPAGMKQERRDGGVWLNAIAADAIHVHLEWGDRLPELARTIADTRVNEALAVQNELHQVQVAQLQYENAELKQTQWSAIERIGAVLGGAGVGAVIAAGVLLLSGAVR